jgi:2-keto-4-pentenoate hydratase/2-oxohepta-3-ene-1,7-dioic acid hydratase in catechol pathway
VDEVEVARLLVAGTLYAEDTVEFLPVVERPGKVICAGLNYGDHAAEASDAGLERSADSRAFAKFPSSLIGHGAPIHYPLETSQLDYEGELAIVIGSSVSRVDPADAWGAIVGYTMFNDISSRDVQFAEMEAGMLLLGKNPAHSSPLGPYLVTADEIGDPHALDLELKVNGEVRQSGSTRELILGCAELVSYWSAVGLEPGDVIATGTPAGVGIFMDPPERYLLKAGDQIELSIGGLGTLRNEVVDPPIKRGEDD